MTTPPIAIAEVLRPLRAATHELHERLDRRLPIAREDATLADYAAHLRALRPWLQSLREALAAPGLPGLDRAAARADRRLAALVLDLDDLDDIGARLDGTAPARGADASPGLAQEAARTPAFAWGLAYVLEGSQLGGAAMHKRLGPRFAPHPMRYFQPPGAPGSMAAQWKDFVSQLGAALADTASVEAARRGAVAGFRSLLPRFGL
ncbi:heme oxygenase [Variovorax sp. TBS-050B]|uniref:biliverdin-producing heme oxygenase n=1 Tax=Variovorax sp. TBS-050B TaxID=2940551 RepID=UPI0024767AD1|nr:biliverdin-producing heme oxygenase [Variovorax sp. TBS-050B]MDH6594058.1 heme oxygenase [Variovorax sp. TBS-050B]